jgi:ribosomal protein S6
MIFLSTAKEDFLEKNIERIRGEIAKLNGSVQDVQALGLRAFARPLKKKDAGIYTRIRFSMEPANVNPLRARLKLNEDIFRAQIVCADMRKKLAPTPPAPVQAQA